MHYTINNKLFVRADTLLYLEIHTNNGEITLEPIKSYQQLSAIYYLAALGRFSPKDSQLSNAPQLQALDEDMFNTLIDSEVICEHEASSCDDLTTSAFGIAQSDQLINPKCTTVQREIVSGQESRSTVTIVDQLLSTTNDTEVLTWAKQLPYRHVDIDSETTTDDKHWVYYLSPPSDYVRSVPFLRVIDNYVRTVANERQYELMRAHIYSGGSNDVYYSHRDSAEGDSLTAIYYPGHWKDHWGGELIFYCDGEPHSVVAKKQGRLVLFRGNVEHRIGAISTSALTQRHSIVLRYNPIVP